MNSRDQGDDAIEKKPELQEYLHTLRLNIITSSEKNIKGRAYQQNIIKEIEDLFKDSRIDIDEYFPGILLKGK